jgi:hypothetical protein
MANDELISALRTLANRFALNARDYARDAKSAADPDKAAYNRGLSEAFYKASMDLAATLKGEDTGSSIGVDPSQISTARLTPPPAKAPASYVAMSESDASRLLEYIDCIPNIVQVRKDGTIYAVFSRWQPIAESERIKKIQGADRRIVILSSGRAKESGDYYVEFALKA